MKKNYLIFCVLSIILLSCLFLTSTTAFAYTDANTYLSNKGESGSTIARKIEVLYQGLKDNTNGFCAAAFSYSASSYGYGDTSPATMMANLGVFKISEDNPLFEFAAKLYEASSVVGLLLVIMYFVIHLLEQVQLDNFNRTQFFKSFIILLIAFIVVLNGVSLFKLLIQLSNNLFSGYVGASVKVSGNVPQVLQDTFNSMYNGGFFPQLGEALSCYVSSTFGYLLYFIAFCVAFAAAISRLIELFVRFALAPIGISSIAEGGIHSAGMRYIKQFAACALTSSVIFLIILGATLVGAVVAKEGSALLSQIVVPVTLIGALAKARGWADNVVGV